MSESWRELNPNLPELWLQSDSSIMEREGLALSDQPRSTPHRRRDALISFPGFIPSQSIILENKS